MSSDVGNTDTSFWVRVEDFDDKVLALRRKELGHLVVGSHDLLVEVRGLWVLEGQVASDHGVEDDSAGPNVGLQTVVTLSSDHLFMKSDPARVRHLLPSIL